MTKKINNIERKNFIWNFLGLTINSFNSLFYLVIINRINGGKEAGIFTFAFSLITLFYFIGIYFNRAYQISTDKYNNKEFLINRFISCILMLLVCVVFCVVKNYSFYKIMIIMLICIFRLLEAFADIFYGMEHKNGLLYKAGKSMFYKSILSLIGFLICDLLTHNIILSIIIIIIINIIGIIFYDIKNSKKYIEKEYKWKNVLAIYKIALPIFIFSFLNVYLVNASKYSLDNYSTAEIQNIFGIILMPGTIISLFSAYITNPYVVDLKNSYKKRDIKSFNKIVIKLSAYIFIFGLLCIAGIYIAGVPLLKLLYGISLEKYKIELVLVIIGAIFLTLASVISAALTIIEKNYIQMYIYIVDAIITFFLVEYLVSNYKIFGASLEYMLIMIIHYIIFMFCYLFNYGKIKKKGKLV